MENSAPSFLEEPTLKKFKMSPTSDDEDGVTTTTNVKKPRYKRRKVALFFGYCGVGYQGMQKNTGAKTIEGDLEEALYLAGAVPEQDRGRPKRFDWSRSARTDKGVSAVCQVISGRFYIDPPGLIDRLHSHLSPQFRIFGYKTVTASFNAQTFCDRRSETALLNSENKEAELISGSNGKEFVEERNRFCYGDKEKDRFNSILKNYVGTHNFHNFTTRIKAEDPSAQRFIVSFSANDSVTVDGIEFVKCEVVGQSFMLHQIRKLIGFAVLIMRNIASELLIKIALQKDISIAVPTAPEVGLYLDECFFTPYNKKWKEIHGEVSMRDYEKEAEEFKIKHIYSHIASTELREGVVGIWLHSLNYLNYPELSVVANSKTVDLKNSEVQITAQDNNPEVVIPANLNSPEVVKLR